MLAEFLKDELQGVTEVEAYKGCLTVSRFDHRLEYCYQKEDWLRSMHAVEDTMADKFTVFGRAQMWTEFSRWMDGLLGEGLPEWVNVAVLSLDMDRGGALGFKGIHVEEDPGENWWEEDEGDARSYGEWPEYGGYAGGPGPWGQRFYGEYCPEVPLLIWEKGLDAASRKQSLREAVKWYGEQEQKARRLKEKGIRVEVEG